MNRWGLEFGIWRVCSTCLELIDHNWQEGIFSISELRTSIS